MTTAPPTLLAVRSLLQQHLGLAAAALGITGDAAHRGGYHCGRDRVVSGDYSVVESERDRSGLSDYASALDIGSWSRSVAGKRHDLRSMSLWIVAQCKAGAADARDIREVIYSPDGQVVRRWDRLGRRITGDSSHLWHTHVSYHRDAITAGRDQTGLMRRYLTTIGLLAGPSTTEVPALDTAQNNALAEVWAATTAVRDGKPAPKAGNHPGGETWLVAQLRTIAATQARIESALAQVYGRDYVDEQAIIAGVLDGLGQRPVDDVAEALRAVFADRPDDLRRLVALLTTSTTS